MKHNHRLNPARLLGRDTRKGHRSGAISRRGPGRRHRH